MKVFESKIRIGDSDRKQMTDLLREYYAGGYLTQEMLDERIQRAVQAEVRGDLEGLVDDLPPVTSLTDEKVQAAVTKKIKKAPMIKRLGSWVSETADDHPVIIGLTWMITSIMVAVMPGTIIAELTHGHPGILIAVWVPLTIIGGINFFVSLLWMIEATL